MVKGGGGCTANHFNRMRAAFGLVAVFAACCSAVVVADAFDDAIAVNSEPFAVASCVYDAASKRYSVVEGRCVLTVTNVLAG